MNTVTITGNLGADVTLLAATADKGAIGNFSIANNELVNGEKKLNGFFDIVVFGAQAERVAATLKKGDRAVIVGRLQQRSWTDAETNTTRRKVEIVANLVTATMEFDDLSITRTPASGLFAPAAE